MESVARCRCDALVITDRKGAEGEAAIMGVSFGQLHQGSGQGEKTHAHKVGRQRQGACCQSPLRTRATASVGVATAGPGTWETYLIPEHRTSLSCALAALGTLGRV